MYTVTGMQTKPIHCVGICKTGFADEQNHKHVFESEVVVVLVGRLTPLNATSKSELNEDRYNQTTGIFGQHV
jgi:hypothetical protein